MAAPFWSAGMGKRQLEHVYTPGDYMLEQPNAC